MINREYLKKVVNNEVKDLGSLLVGGLLWAASFFFWVILLIRQALYRLGILRSYRFQQKVISVGNLTVGGVGKTPFVQYVAEYLNGRSKKVAVLMRGYKASSGISDEAELLTVNLPKVKVLAGKNRVQNAREYLRSNTADAFILDDGFQHLKIQRDLDIVIIDSTNPWGSGFLLPRGILRERLPALSRADVVVLSKVDLGKENIPFIRKKVSELNPKCTVVESIHQPTHLVDIKTQNRIELSFLQGRIICALSAIGSPDSFEHLLRVSGAVTEESFRFIDHHSFSRNDIANVVQFCQAHRITTVVTTQKDAVKLGKILQELKPDIQFVYLSIQLTITQGEEELRGRIDSVLSH